MTADDATEQLVRIHEYTDERGYATAEVIDDPYVSGERLFVPVELLTTGDRHTLDFELPTTWSEEYPVVRLVESVGYGPGGIDLLVGERFPVEIAADGVTLEPVFDLEGPTEPGRTIAGVSIPEPSRETFDRGAVGAFRLTARTAKYALALATFSIVISVGAGVAATITYAIVLGGFVATSLTGSIGGFGLLFFTLLFLSAVRSRISRRLRGGGTRVASRSGPERYRYR